MPRRWLDQNFFTDEKVGRLSMPERQLFAAMIANQDDDGRLKGHPAYLRSIAFPYDEFTTEEVTKMRDRVAEANPNVIVYHNAGEDYVQLKRHKRYQKPRYYHPSKLPAPPGWPFEEEHPPSNQVVTKKQPASNQTDTKRHTEDRVGLGNNLDLDLGKDKGRDRVMGAHRAHPPPSPATQIQIYDKFVECFENGWGLKTTGKILAQIRDFSQELSIAGCPISYVQEAFREAADLNKLHLAYVRGILLDWVGIPRAPP